MCAELSLLSNKCWLQLMHRLFLVGSIPYTLLLTGSDVFIKMMEELVLSCDFLLCTVITRKLDL